MIMFTVILYLFLIVSMTYILVHDIILYGFDMYALGCSALIFVLIFVVMLILRVFVVL